MTDYGFVIHKGTRIVSDRLVSTVVYLGVKDDGSLRSALKVIWDEIFEKDYSAWIKDEDYIPLGFEDPEDVERVLEAEPGTAAYDRENDTLAADTLLWRDLYLSMPDSFGGAIKEVLKRKGITQEELAVILCVTARL